MKSTYIVFRLWVVARVAKTGRHFSTFGIKTAVIKGSEAFKVIDQCSEWKLYSDKWIKYEFMDCDGRLLEKGTFEGLKYISKPSVKGIIYCECIVIVI